MDGTQQSGNSDGSWKFTPGEVAQPVQTFASQTESVSQPRTVDTGYSITWTASEFVAHQKSAQWYFVLAAIAIVSSVVVFFVTHDIVSSIVILLAAIAFGVVAARQPRELSYQLDEFGLTIGTRHYSYMEFRSFSIVQEGAFSSIVFMPLKRFMPLTTIYYDPNDEERIVELLSAVLPFEPRRHDPVDNLLWRIRF